MEIAARRRQLGRHLRAMRARLDPTLVGLPTDHGRRRTPGLRREEVAQLSGVSVTWLTWLEQGRNITASGQVIDALARALRLDPAENRLLRDLAGVADVPSKDRVPSALSDLQRMVGIAMPNPAMGFDENLDIIVWNPAYARVRQDPAVLPVKRRNVLWEIFFEEQMLGTLGNWDLNAQKCLGWFRSIVARNPDNPRLAEIIAELSAASPLFRHWWPLYVINDLENAPAVIHHPEVGRIEFDVCLMHPALDPGLTLAVMMPASTNDQAAVDALLTTA